MSTRTRSQRVHELGLKLTVLIVVTVVAFLATRTVALHARRRTLADAASRYARGVAALAAGNTGLALDSLRSASVKDRSNSEYGLAFAQALIANHQIDAAERALRALREQVPEHPAVNLELARIAARRGDLQMALRYYRYALYAPWPNGDGPRRVREELVRFLLDRHDRTHAVAELVAARATTPDQPATHVHLGRLFLDADEPRLALEEFRRALQLDDSSPEAHELAGLAAYRIGNYAMAAHDLQRAGDVDTHSARLREIALAVINTDPLAARLTAATRLSRTRQLLDVTADRISTCVAGPDRTERLRRVDRMRQRLRRSGGRDTTVIEDAVDVAFSEVVRLRGVCDLQTPAIEALLILARRESDGQP